MADLRADMMKRLEALAAANPQALMQGGVRVPSPEDMAALAGTVQPQAAPRAAPPSDGMPVINPGNPDQAMPQVIPQNLDPGILAGGQQTPAGPGLAKLQAILQAMGR